MAKKQRQAEDIHATALKRFDAAWQREQDNIDAAYDDLTFLANENDAQWPEEVKTARQQEGRPCQTINRLVQFVRQITGDIRSMKPAIKVVPVDEQADEKIASDIAGIVRYVENRSEGGAAYYKAADQQVAAGIGHWQIITEYAGERTFEQEVKIVPIEDGISVVWDPDAISATKEDAKYCFVPEDMSRDAFEARYPDKSPAELTSTTYAWLGDWVTSDTIRVQHYWLKEPVTRKLAMINGQVIELDDALPADVAALQAAGARVESREGFKVRKYVLSASDILEGPIEWAGSDIPIVPVIGDEIQIGKRRIRFGVVRHAKDAQRAYNYYMSAHTEVVGLQPKAPFVGTEKQIKPFEAMWQQANRKNFSVLLFNPDDKAPGAPQRVQPPVSSQGILDGLKLAVEDMKATTGIYDASLGNRSNETSGRAIMARQREGDTANMVYIDNFTRAIRRTGEILVRLIPKIYDTERTVRILGDDGKIDRIKINQAVMVNGVPATSRDVTVGSYDVVVESGPSYSTRREEARDGMTAFMQGSPQAAPIMLDLYAKAQDWPDADRIARRARAAFVPPNVLAAEDAEENGQSGQPPAPPQQPQPNPVEQAEAEAKVMKAQADAKKAVIEAQIKEIELQLKIRQLQAPVTQPDMMQQESPNFA